MNAITSQLGSQLSLVSLNGARRPRRRRSSSSRTAAATRALSTVRTLIERVRELRPHLSVRLGHIELNEPLLADALASLDAEGAANSAVLVPLLLSRGYHVKRDIPRPRPPHRDCGPSPPRSPHPLLVETLYERLVDQAGGPGRATRPGAPSGWPCSPPRARATRSRSSTPAAPPSCWPNASACPSSAYASAAAPTVAAAVRALAARGRHRIAVASYFTAPGRFATECAAAAPWIATAPLGTHAAMARLILHRYDQAVATPEPAPERELASA